MVSTADNAAAPEHGPDVEAVNAALGTRHVVLVGMMGSGKSSIGRRLARTLGRPFVDADSEIEKASAMSIADFFSVYGETAFREGEVRVISRLLDEHAPSVIATGGGAWMSPETRAHTARCGVSIWLKADPEVLMKRVRRRPTRPLLQTPDPEGTLRRLLAAREADYATADMTVISEDGLHETVVASTLAALQGYIVRTRTPPE